MKKSRKLKKAIKNSIIIYDISAIPHGLDLGELYRIFNDYGMLFYDSSRGDNPTLANRVGKRVKIIDKKE